jgi:hypothetical protein
MTNELQKEVVRIALTVSGMTTSNFFFPNAPPNTPFPYSVLSEISNPNTWDSKSDYETANIQFAVYGHTIASINTLAEAIMAKFDHGQSEFSSLTTLTCVDCQRTSYMRGKIETGVPGEEVGRIIIECSIEVQKNRTR